jgi:mannose-6-phosphate isomerase-like protein (cupin superfamily)
MKHVLTHWGWYEVLLHDPGYKVKRIVVFPGHRLSLQSHEHRDEHWTIVQGTGNVIIDIWELPVAPNQCFFIKKGQRHRVHNTGETALVFIEVQIGSPLEEEDITRYEDDYGRV